MFDYLIDHAIKNVWCNPAQDNQHIFSLTHISGKHGSLNRAKLMMREIRLPTQGSYYHLFQVGNIPAFLLGLLQLESNPVVDQWVSVADSINFNKAVIDVYTEGGVNLPRSEVYYCYTPDRDLVFAIKNIADYPVNTGEENIYVRIYNNAYFETQRADQTNDVVFTEHAWIDDNWSAIKAKNRVLELSKKPGLVYLYVNGYLKLEVNLAKVTTGDYVEWVYDSSVERVVTFPVSSLPTFVSSLDNKRKYLLHYEYSNVSSIEYHDDIDFFIVDDSVVGNVTGLYYHRNSVDAVRMVTHRDYSICVPYFVYLAGKLTELAGGTLDMRSMKIRMHVRKSGYFRPLIHEHNRLHELYKLPDYLVSQALLGMNATVAGWRADLLENSAYCKLMATRAELIDREIIQNAYGYNGISKIVGDTPSKSINYSGTKLITPPYALQFNSTVYEYDADGLLLGHYLHNGGTHYTCRNMTCVVGEVISGIASQQLDERFGTDNITLPVTDNYRVYMAHNGLDRVDDVWTDITDTEHYAVENNVLKWKSLQYDQFLMVRTDARFLAYDLELPMRDGVIRFDLTSIQDRDGTGPSNRILTVPLGELDVFVNEHSLIKDLDYQYVFPEIVITSKEYLGSDPNNGVHTVHIRFTGFCTRELELSVVQDTGFIEHGMLSNNNRFDLRDDKVQRIVVGGSVITKDKLSFSEEHSGVSVVNHDNGLPYCVRDIVVPMRGLTDENTYSLRNKSLAVDKIVSDYLTLKLPQPERNAPSSIRRRYELYSPFVANIISLLRRNSISTEMVSKNLSDKEIMEICKPYEELLRFDPTQPQVTIDHDYVVIHPHNSYSVITLNLFKFRFIRRVVGLYCNGKVELTPFVALEELKDINNG